MSHHDPLYTDPSLVDFYDAENGWTADLALCATMADDAASVLDLGCGTGTFLTGIAAPVRIGVDPARAMLEAARARPGAGAVRWIEADARHVRLDRRFDLIVMTGHAFQVFLTPDDQRAALATIAHHLAPGGRFVFDTRNPLCREWQDWQPHNSRRTVEHPRHGCVTSWNTADHDPATGIVTYGTFYRLADGRTLSADSRIRFTPRDELGRLIEEAGLVVERWLGDWSGGPIADDAPEIIPIGRRA